MGTTQAILTQEEIEGLEKDTTFTEDEIKFLLDKFHTLDDDGNGAISLEEFKMVPDLAFNPLLERIITTFGLNEDNEVEFLSLLNSLNVFNQKTDLRKKLEFCFKVYDIDGDGYISNGELYTVLKTMVGTNLTGYQLQQIVDKTILEGDSSKKGRISFKDFCRIIKLDLRKSLNFTFSEERGKKKIFKIPVPPDGVKDGATQKANPTQ